MKEKMAKKKSVFITDQVDEIKSATTDNVTASEVDRAMRVEHLQTISERRNE